MRSWLCWCLLVASEVLVVLGLLLAISALAWAAVLLLEQFLLWALPRA